MRLAHKYAFVAASALGCLGVVATVLSSAPAAPAEAVAQPAAVVVQQQVAADLADSPAEARTTEVTRSTERETVAGAAAEQVTKRRTTLTRDSKSIQARIAKIKADELARIKELGYEPGTKDPREIARQMMKNKYGWDESQFQCYDHIIMRESRWLWYADNPHSSAYGIPQALPGSRMASAGADWRTNPATQIKWGLGYVKERYGTPCSAWSFKRGHGWY